MNILLDRDGTVIQDRHYLSDPDQVHLLPGTGPALRSLLEIGCRLFLITNQSGIGRGFFTLKTFLSVQERLNDLLASEGVYFEDQVYCPHSPEAGCSCRKPEIMMWKELVHRHGLQPERSVMIGDKEADLAFGAGAGLGLLVLVLTGYGLRTAEQMACPAMPCAARVLEMNRTGCAPDLLARDLPAACAWIRKRLLGRTSR